MLYLVGLGLGDATDITLRGLEIVKRASRVYLEAYTSILTVGKYELVSYISLPCRLCRLAATAPTSFSLMCGWVCQEAVIVQEKVYGRKLILADREMVEQNADMLLAGAAEEDIAFLVVGDPLG